MSSKKITKKTVLVFGTFDLLHPGHRAFLRQAKKLGDVLVVVVARDLTVNKLKRHAPHQVELKRAQNVKKLKLANRVLLGSLKDPYQIIKKIKPDIIALGYDQSHFIADLPAKLKEFELPTKIIRLKSYYPKKNKSSFLKNLELRIKD